MLNAVLRPLATVHYTRALDAIEVHASDASRALSGRQDAARVLLVGSGVTTGWGVQTHGLALVGSLRRELQIGLGRPVDVEQVSVLGAALSTASAVIAERASEQWDAIVIAFGLRDAMCLTPVEAWARDLGHLLAKLDSDMPRGLLVPIVIAGVPPVGSLGALRLLLPLRPFITRHGERLNAATRAMVARNRRAVFVALPGMANSTERPTGSPEAYRTWAATISDALHPLIAPRPDDVRAPSGREDIAAAVLAPRNAQVRAALRDVVERTATHYSAAAALDIVRDGRLQTVARSAGSDPTDRQALSIETLRVGLLHVRDVVEHARLEGLDADADVVSYLGLAVHDGHGAAVGSLSVVGGGTIDPVDPVVLHEFGSLVEAQLALLEDDALVAVDHDDRAGWRTPVAQPERPTAPTHWDDGPEDPSALEGSLHHGRPRGPITRQRRLQQEGRLLTELASERSVPVETDFWISGADPIRVLLIGGEYSVGFGASTRDDALDGALAWLLHTRTGRGVLVENRAQQGVRLHQLADSLGPAGAATFDLVVWTPTFLEATRLLFRSRWFTGIESMLRRIEATSTASVVLMGYPSLLGSQPLAVLGRTRAGQINRLLRRIAARHSRVEVAEPPGIALQNVESSDGPQVYRDTAVRISPAALDLLEAGDLRRLLGSLSVDAEGVVAPVAALV